MPPGVHKQELSEAVAEAIGMAYILLHLQLTIKIKARNTI